MRTVQKNLFVMLASSAIGVACSSGLPSNNNDNDAGHIGNGGNSSSSTSSVGGPALGGNSGKVGGASAAGGTTGSINPAGGATSGGGTSGTTTGSAGGNTGVSSQTGGSRNAIGGTTATTITSTTAGTSHIGGATNADGTVNGTGGLDGVGGTSAASSTIAIGGTSATGGAATGGASVVTTVLNSFDTPSQMVFTLVTYVPTDCQVNVAAANNAGASAQIAWSDSADVNADATVKGSMKVVATFTDWNQQLQVEMDGPTNSSGGPLDLTNKTVRVNVEALSGLSPSAARPYGVVLYVKTGTNYVWGGSSWVNFDTVGSWVTLSLNMADPGVSSNAAFDPKNPALLGIKFGTGGGGESTFCAQDYAVPFGDPVTLVAYVDCIVVENNPTNQGTGGTGGTSGIGGAATTGGTAAAGGSNATGGSVSTGGAPATGGVVSTGGVTSSGGEPATGGTVSSGGTDAAGGTSGLGGGGATIPTGCAAVSGTPYFCDDFESGLSKWLVGVSGWNTMNTNSQSPTHAVTDSPDGNHSQGAVNAITMVASVDLTTSVLPILTFWQLLALTCTPGWCTFNSPSYSDHVYVEVSTDSGTTWSQLSDMWNGSNTSTWLLQQLSLSAYVGNKIKLRFRLVDNNDGTEGDGWYIDDVVIQEAN